MRYTSVSRLLPLLLLFATSASSAVGITLSVAELASLTPPPRVVDARPAADYLEGHIEGAVNLPVEMTYAPGLVFKMLAPINTLERLIGERGIDRDSHVVLVDDGSMLDAAWLFWLLETHGMQRVSLLEGGMPAWREAGGAVSRNPPAVEPVRFVARLRPETIALKMDMRLAVASGRDSILDNRAPSHFRGEESIGPRRGHIPGAVNLFWQDLIEEGPHGNRLLAADELQATFARVDPERRETLLYCNKGLASAVAYVAMRVTGRQPRLYDGSWEEWSHDINMPIAGAR